jgi:hypothetical protein
MQRWTLGTPSFVCHKILKEQAPTFIKSMVNDTPSEMNLTFLDGIIPLLGKISPD